ncbi:unnamed protein product [Effrenium voratum]|nr:unnamed protein product [Effrenium voratum]
MGAAHFRRLDQNPPTEASGWLKQTAQLELFQEELQWVLQQNEGKVPSDSPSETPKEAPEPKPEPESHEGKDLGTARQQLHNCEREHAYLQQMLGYDDAVFREERLAEIRDVEEEIELEQRKVRRLETENRKRERSLARAVRAGLESDGSSKAMRQTEQLESESAVWLVKNENLQKQILQLSIYLKQDTEKLEHLQRKLKALRDKLESDEAKQWIEEQRQMEEQRWNEEQALTAEVRALQDRRVSEENASKKSHADKLKQLADLRKTQATLESQLAPLEATERQLRRHMRLLRRRKEAEGEGAEANAQSANGQAILHTEQEAAGGADDEGLTTNIDHVAATLAQYVLTTEQAGGSSSSDIRNDKEDSSNETQKVSSDPPPKELGPEDADTNPADIGTAKVGGGDQGQVLITEEPVSTDDRGTS